ncbi:glutamate-5-semialdehyde dehydrogenase [Aggregatibacter actinomycetemcomitans]|uniref:Glutamate-5-semialdehyde dehydrogenase n=1 Tax=Aggregatibacter actinomycetemcomitans TaxID=714 RepID=A0A5D0EPJ7_AGGAC|nr:glutamate-5-semialdehyde dehydrogenase [Aggregatibacter actinomycetemcomitans D7S-1]AMQ93497.1 glutamate-5-semialdehyde dehydrogenase [Aggregatibacter actinomycetemcomitans]EKX97956.1 putative glutamate-5-semialdehyde dehydrogenase [Aggregatibacter actinomycetemcomitans Y4]KND83811.1 glutamate-5-semialdehyde dehydrogenase [Aggregatibacter actinomycetemcomitans serotype a str. H5P1]KOE30713.1 glutamate-5-semialdehyde dehydrogenase [Aggregatibacter actinomycetemcomitans D17P-3]KOE66103.1 glut
MELEQERILAANAQNIDAAKQSGLSDAIIDRLLLTPERLQGIANDVHHVISLADPVGQIIDGGLLDSGVKIERVCVPLGVIGTIYEARPNVTIDVVGLCLKTGNAVVLRGSKETQHSNKVLVEVVQNALQAVAHIRQYGSRHSDSILTASQKLAQQFITQVDSAAVYVNASTRFTDGEQFGLGAEVAVST